MNRSLLLTAVAMLLLSACTAKLEETCVGGPCEAGKPDTAGSTTSTGAGGAGGAGGADAGPDCSAVPTTGEFPCDVYDVLVANCHKCHTDPTAAGAPFPLLAFEKTRESYIGAPIWEKMRTAISSDFMPLGGPPLSDADRETMNAWFAQCAPPVPDGTGCEAKP